MKISKTQLPASLAAALSAAAAQGIAIPCIEVGIGGCPCDGIKVRDGVRLIHPETYRRIADGEVQGLDENDRELARITFHVETGTGTEQSLVAVIATPDDEVKTPAERDMIDALRERFPNLAGAADVIKDKKRHRKHVAIIKGLDAMVVAQVGEEPEGEVDADAALDNSARRDRAGTNGTRN